MPMPMPMTLPGQTPDAERPGPEPDAAPGRTCPLHYRYRPQDLAASTPVLRCDTLYVVGGLYGNEPALETVLRLFEAEPAADKRLVFNGDFHWFDVDPAVFERIDTAVAQFDAIRGNVETEIADRDADPESGCGCSYPTWVGDGVVERSNRIIARLRATARRFPQRCERLRALPMWLRAEVGGSRVGIVHGDAHSLAGWDFAPEALADPAHRERVRGCFEPAQVDILASTHTCSPLLQGWGAPASNHAPQHDRGDADRVLVNNGAAGMPNLAGERDRAADPHRDPTAHRRAAQPRPSAAKRRNLRRSGGDRLRRCPLAARLQRRLACRQRRA